jgi:hypothetical protein
VGTGQKHTGRSRMSEGKNVHILSNPVKIITVEGKYTNNKKTISVELCPGDANIFVGTWNVGINCVKIHLENITKGAIFNSVNISTNLVKAYHNTSHGVQNYNLTIGCFFWKLADLTQTNTMHFMIYPP